LSINGKMSETSSVAGEARRKIEAKIGKSIISKQSVKKIV